MPTVAFDAVGPSASGAGGATSPLTWSHINSGNAIVVGCTVYTGATNTITSVTYGGVALSFLGFIQGGAGGAGGIAMYGKVGGLPTGANTVSVAFTGGGNVNAGSISFTGAGSLGTPVTASANAASVTASVAGTTTGGMIAAAASYGGSGLVSFAGTNGVTVRWSHPGSTNTGADNGVGGTVVSTGGGAAQTVGFSDTGSDYWGLVAVEVQPATSTPVSSADTAKATEGSSTAGGTTPHSSDTGHSAEGSAIQATASGADSAHAAEQAATTAYITGIAGSGQTAYFASNAGKPRFLLADNPWALIPNAGRWGGTWQNDIDTYCNNRGSQGFTAIYLDPLGNTENSCAFADGRTFDGIYPFTVNGTAGTTSGVASSATIGLNGPFWSRVDYFIAACTRNGMTAMLNIGYDGGTTSDYGTGGALASLTATQHQQYGGALAARYAGTPNIIWLVGNDYFGGTGGTVGSGGGTPAGNDTLYEGTLTGLRNGGDSHVISIHNFVESDSRQDLGSTTSGTAQYWGNNHGQFNGNYTYNVTYLGIEDAYAEANPICVMQLDGYFYQGSSTYFSNYDRSFRQDAWWAIASGARGVCQGSESIWQWTSTSLAASGTDWFYVNNAKNIRTALEALPNWHKLVPATGSTLITAGRGTRAAAVASGGSGGQYEPAFTNSYVAASITADGTLALCYLPNAATITVTTAPLAAGGSWHWIDPVSGASYPASGTTSFNSGAADGSKAATNSQGDPDWVLAYTGPVTANLAGADSAAAAGAPKTVGVGRPVTARGWVS